MADVTIRALKNGPYEVTGGATVTDQKRTNTPDKETRSICVAADNRQTNRSVMAPTPKSDSKPKRRLDKIITLRWA